MKNLFFLIVAISIGFPLFSQTDSIDIKVAPKSIAEKKQYFGVFAGGITGTIGNKHIGFTQGFGGSIGITFGTGGMIDADFVRFRGQATNKEMLPDGTAIDIWAFGFSGDFYIFSRHAIRNPIRPYIKCGASMMFIYTGNNIAHRDYDGYGFILGTGTDIWLGKYLSLYAEGTYRFTGFSKYSLGTDDFAENHKKLLSLFGIQGGLRLIIPIRDI